MRNLGIVQVRMSSTRFPGKALAPFGGSTILNVLLSRLSQSKTLDEIVVATSLDASDDILVSSFPNKNLFRGNLVDVRSRFIELGEKYSPKNIVRITGDCPLVCNDLVDEMMTIHEKEESDYTANCNLSPYPKGFDIEIFKTEVLYHENYLTESSYHKEHVTPWMYESDELKVTNIQFPQDDSSTMYNFSIDTQKDLQFLTDLELRHSISRLSFNEIRALI